MAKSKRLQISCDVLVFDSLDDLERADRDLILLAAKARAKSYAPYSNFLVGAAVRLDDGTMLSGGNQENAAYPMCLCAEQVVLAAATAQYPGIPVRAIAVTAANPDLVLNEPAGPCGSCRQVIAEHEARAKAPITVLLRGEVGAIYKLKGGDLLPVGFNAKFLG